MAQRDELAENLTGLSDKELYDAWRQSQQVAWSIRVEADKRGLPLLWVLDEKGEPVPVESEPVSGSSYQTGLDWHQVL